MKELIGSAKEWTAGYGDPFKEGALGGPLVSKLQRDKVAGFVDSARQEGAQIVYGGDKWEGKGWYYLPTSECHLWKMSMFRAYFALSSMGGYLTMLRGLYAVIGDVTPQMKVVKEEVCFLSNSFAGRLNFPVTDDPQLFLPSLGLVPVRYFNYRLNCAILPRPRVARNCAKIFGPVLVVSKFETEDEVIELANNTTYGLGAGFHSRTSFLSQHRPFGPPRNAFSHHTAFLTFFGYTYRRRQSMPTCFGEARGRHCVGEPVWDTV
jgi:hypothetical protein